ncbi:DNA-directed RNA polymerase I subunit-like protein [Hapsidospora chrysogenum ATCC 11550]|uniref:DNA-directed RNA polymerase subunit n=1 Tax=Hapsidospora chrysogenum (strain ATCC 11550 / CBS 779.69 / DSM 880 / IAM 14645 / JCM 23072 / IMI 49137) TaxID=857340 RepID=A0A086TCT3_HAPC1|nr:DNA-directed RNA polymerase I subunit-like protein [Hapsidospora chrysogenum ATCC 11550]
MGVQFCADCGNLLPISQTEQAGCECCGSVNQNKLLESVSNSSTNTFPSELRDRRGVVKRAKPAHSADTWSTIDVKCPKCHANKVRYTTLQLRSADEGSTVFYSCSECSER